MSKIKNVTDLLVTELTDILNAERQGQQSLPNITKRVTSSQLRVTLERHHAETDAQLRRLQMIFSELNIAPEVDRLSGAPWEFISQEIPRGEALDNAVIDSMRRVEHHEMNAYTSARALARLLGYRRIAELLAKTFDEEWNTDRSLALLAQPQLALA